MVVSERTKWFALALLCVTQFVVVLDIAIVNVALPSIQADLGFSQENLQWVISAYALVFGGFLLLGGRLGDDPALGALGPDHDFQGGARAKHRAWRMGRCRWIRGGRRRPARGHP